jgi:DNA-directed RNA polymerase subunit RPC12/RpoP
MELGAVAGGSMSGASSYYAKGQWNFICDQCGQQYKSQYARKQWDGLIVCPRCLDPRNQQEFIKARPERSIPWSRPDQPTTISATQQFVDGAAVGATWVG